MELYWLNKEDILKQVSSEYQLWYDTIQDRRDKKRDDLKRYVEESDKEKVNIHSIFWAIQTLMAIFYVNRLSIEWQRRRTWDREVTKNCNKVADYDYKEMNLDVEDYNWEFHRFMFWVWIQISDWFDKIKKIPRIKTINPLSWIPDPEWWPTIKDHRFAWFEVQMKKSEMLKKWYDKDEVDKLWTAVEQELNREAKKDPRWLTDSIDDTSDKIRDIYHHYMIIDGKKYLATTNASQTILLDFKYLNPILLEEKEDEDNVYFPIALKYYSYVDWDCYWISVPDLLRDKQSAYSKIFNLLLITATRNALWDDKLVNTKKIKDLKWLMTPQIWWKLIPVNIWDNENIQNVISTIPKDNPWQMPFNLKDMLQEQIYASPWIDRNQMWVLSNSYATKAETEMAQTNANMRFLLASKQWMWWEEFRWKYLWYRQYVANLKSIENKEIALSNWWIVTISAFKKDDFIWWELLWLKIINKTEEEQRKVANRAARLSMYPQLLENAKSEWERICIFRDMMRDSWFTEDEIEEKLRFTPDELNAFNKLVLIENNDEEWANIDSLDEDHRTYIYIFQTADDSSLKQEAISRRYEALKLKQEQDLQNQMMMWNQAPAQKNASNIAAAQLTNAAIQSSQPWWTWNIGSY